MQNISEPIAATEPPFPFAMVRIDRLSTESRLEGVGAMIKESFFFFRRHPQYKHFIDKNHAQTISNPGDGRRDPLFGEATAPCWCSTQPTHSPLISTSDDKRKTIARHQPFEASGEEPSRFTTTDFR